MSKVEATQFDPKPTNENFEPSDDQMEKAAKVYHSVQVESDLEERVVDPEMFEQFFEKDRDENSARRP